MATLKCLHCGHIDDENDWPEIKSFGDLVPICPSCGSDKSQVVSSNTNKEEPKEREKNGQ